MAAVFRTAAALSFLASQILPCKAHMQMDWPFPLRSPLDPTVPESLKDYDMASPLKNDGSNFPCKLYQNNATNPQAYAIKAVYEAGSTYNISVTGGASHMGGSCQISLSYDNGATFKVIESMIGGCPLSPNYFFTVPDFAPSSDTVLLSWSWFNLIGNRDMYQNCARVQVVGGSLPTTSNRRRDVKYRSRRQTSLDSLPDMFECNIGNGCTTIEKRQVVFPNPGPSVLYGQDATIPDPGPGFTLATSGSTTISTTTPLSVSSTFAPFPALNTTSSLRALTVVSTTSSSTPAFPNTTFATLGGVFVSASSTLSFPGSGTGLVPTSSSSFSSVVSSSSVELSSSTTTLRTLITTSNGSVLSTTSSSAVAASVTSAPFFTNSTSASNSASNTTSSSVLNTTTSASGSTSTGGVVSSTTSSSPTVVTVTVTVTATPLSSVSGVTALPSLAEVLTIVPISQLSVLGPVVSTASS